MQKSTSIKVIGQIKTVFPEETFGNFTKKAVWIEETDQQYPQTFEIEFTQAKVKELEGFKAGDLVELDADVRGRFVSKNGKEYVFNSLSGWAIKRI